MEEKKIVEEESFAKALLKEYAKTAKRWFIIAMVILFAWLATIGGFLLYLNQYDFSSTSIEATQDGEGVNIANCGDLNYGAES